MFNIFSIKRADDAYGERVYINTWGFIVFVVTIYGSLLILIPLISQLSCFKAHYEVKNIRICQEEGAPNRALGSR